MTRRSRKFGIRRARNAVVLAALMVSTGDHARPALTAEQFRKWAEADESFLGMM